MDYTDPPGFNDGLGYGWGLPAPIYNATESGYPTRLQLYLVGINLVMLVFNVKPLEIMLELGSMQIFLSIPHSL